VTQNPFTILVLLVLATGWYMPSRLRLACVRWAAASHPVQVEQRSNSHFRPRRPPHLSTSRQVESTQPAFEAGASIALSRRQGVLGGIVKPCPALAPGAGRRSCPPTFLRCNFCRESTRMESIRVGWYPCFCARTNSGRRRGQAMSL